MFEPRAYTPDEVREQFLRSIIGMIAYWNSENGSNVSLLRSNRDRLEGLTHSILVLLDGGHGMMPAFEMRPACTKEDQEFRRAQQMHWYDSTQVMNPCQLHDEFWAMIAARKKS
jgi:hypothetical protein